MKWLKPPVPNRIFGLLAGAALLVQGGEGLAIGAFNPTQADLRMLPPYCAVRAQKWGNDRNDPRTRKWFSLFGNDFIHLHHYCGAMLDFWKAPLEMDGKQRRKRYEHSLYNFDYVAERVSPNFILWPELLVYRSRVHDKLGHAHEAMRDAREAVRRKPDYVQAVVNLADLLVRQGKRKEAEQVVLTGLKRKPSSKALKRRKACLERKESGKCPDGY